MKVIVVGAGPAGVATSLLLARCGVEVVLLERETSLDRTFRGEGLMPSGMDALFQMGLREMLAAIPQRLVESWDIYIDGEAVFVIPEPIDELGERATRVVSQPAFLEAAIESALHYPGFSMRRGTQVRDLLIDDGRVAGVVVEDVEGRGELRAGLVIGCDGRGSPTRSRAGLKLELQPEHYDVLWFKLPAPERLADLCSIMIMVRARRHPAICYTSWDGRLQYGLILPKGGLDSLPEDWLKESVESAPDWLAAHVLGNRSEVEGPTRLSVIVGRAPEWTRPGLLLIGDAAHPMSPVRAQGINLAFRDAIVTANHLVPAIRSDKGPRALDAAARAVQAEREPEIRRAQKLQAREAQGQGDARSASWRFSFARRVAPVLGRYRWAQRAWLGRQKELRFGSTDVRLRVACDEPAESPRHQ